MVIRKKESKIYPKDKIEPIGTVLYAHLHTGVEAIWKSSKIYRA